MKNLSVGLRVSLALFAIGALSCGSVYGSNGPVPGVAYIYQTMHFWGYFGLTNADIPSTRANLYGFSCDLTVGRVNALPEYDRGDSFRKDTLKCGTDLGYIDTGVNTFIKGKMLVDGTTTCRPKEGKPDSVCEGFPTNWTRTFEWIGYPVVDRIHSKSCPDLIGNPIAPLLASKHMAVSIDGAGSGLTLRYDSRPRVPTDNPQLVYNPLVSPSFGDIWSSSLHQKIVPQNAAGVLALQVSRGTGIWTSFVKSGGVYYPDADIADQVVDTTNGWRYTDISGGAQEVYASDGSLQSKVTAQGRSQTYKYSDQFTSPDVAPMSGLLIGVTDQFGRSTDFSYTVVGGFPRIRSISSGGQATSFSYDTALNLEEITWPDQKARRFLYGRPDIPWALTGIVDENGITNATYQYDPEGRAFDTQRAGGVDHYSVSWTSPPNSDTQLAWDPTKNIYWRDHRWTAPAGTLVSLPSGQSAMLGGGEVQGMPRVTYREQPAGSGCDPSAASLNYDSRGLVTSRVDFNQMRSCHAYASDRHVEMYRIEGLGEADACPLDLAAYQVPSDLPANKPRRKVSTKWHPLWKLEAQRAEPKRITTTVYNGERDPIDTAHPILNCAVGAPVLPDGVSNIAVVCRRYEQSTEDETGNLGFSAAVANTRTWSYEYNQYGQLKQETDPRGKVTKYEYWAQTAFTGDGNGARGQWKGDLRWAENALGQKTEHLEYNKRGQVLTTKYANGGHELREYHERGWLTKVTQVPAGSGVGQVTQYEYYDTGLLKKVTQPDGSFAKYIWDDAHRLTDVEDSVGNKVHYELDNAGNRENETFTDKNGELAKTISRTFDALGRLSSSTGLQ